MEGSPKKELRSQEGGQDVRGLGPFTTPLWGPGLAPGSSSECKSRVSTAWVTAE